MPNDHQTVGDAVEDQYYASQGVRTGSAYNDYLVTQRETSQKRRSSVSNAGDARGIGILILSIVFLGSCYVIGAGYVLSAELVSNYWLDHRLLSQNWYYVSIYAGFSIVSVVIVARYWGFLFGLLVGLVPALPLYFATKGHIGFWYIVQNGGEDVMDNVFSSWIAFIGMVTIHSFIAWSVQRADESFSMRLLRWRWIVTPIGIATTIIMLGSSIAVVYIVWVAVQHY